MAGTKVAAGAQQELSEFCINSEGRASGSNELDTQHDKKWESKTTPALSYLSSWKDGLAVF